MEPGHKGPVPGAVHPFILAGGRCSSVYPLHLSDVSPHRFPPLRPPPFPPSPAPLRALHFSLLPPGSSSPPRLSRPRRTAGWRSGSGSCASWRRSGCDGLRLRLRPTTAGKFGFFRGGKAELWRRRRSSRPSVFGTLHVHMWRGLLTPTSVHINYCVCRAPPLVAELIEMWPRKHRKSQPSFELKHLTDFQPFESFKRVYFRSFWGGNIPTQRFKTTSWGPSSPRRVRRRDSADFGIHSAACVATVQK